MHIVLLNVFHIDRTERAQAYMQCDKAKVDPHVLEFLHLFLGEVQTSRWSGC